MGSTPTLGTIIRWDPLGFIRGSSKGRTSDFGSDYLGSNPSPRAMTIKIIPPGIPPGIIIEPKVNDLSNAFALKGADGMVKWTMPSDSHRELFYNIARFLVDKYNVDKNKTEINCCIEPALDYRPTISDFSDLLKEQNAVFVISDLVIINHVLLYNSDTAIFRPRTELIFTIRDIGLYELVKGQV